MPDQNVQSQINTAEAKKINTEKIIGYFLLALGIFLILLATFLALRVFFGKAQPYSVFSVVAPSIKIPNPSSSLQITEGITLPPGISINQQEGKDSEVKILSDEVFNSLLNMGVFYLAMMFLASSGAKFADLGIKMVKEIRLQIKN